MRILHILDHSVPVHTAYSHRTLSLLRQQRALGWHTIQLTGPAQGQVETEDRNRDGWHFFRTGPGAGGFPLDAWRMARRLAHAITLTRPDILHAHPPVLNAFAALHAARRAGLPLVASMPGRLHAPCVGDWITRALERRVARRAHAVVADSGAMRAWLLAGGAHPARTCIVPPSPNAAASQVDGRHAGFGAGPVIFCSGTVKNAAVLVSALPALLQAHPGLQLVFAGDGGQPGHPAPRGTVVVAAREHAAAVRSSADMLVFPEPASPSLLVPMRPLDAMAHGALVVASDTPMHRELVEHGRNGILFEAGNAAALAEAVLALLAEPQCMRQLRERARTFAARERGWEAAARLYGRVYAELTENGGR